MSKISKYASDNVAKIIVGSKTDLGASRQVATEEGAGFAVSTGATFMEVSAKENVNINELF